MRIPGGAGRAAIREERSEQARAKRNRVGQRQILAREQAARGKGVRRPAVAGDGNLVVRVFGQDEFHVSPLFRRYPGAGCYYCRLSHSLLNLLAEITSRNLNSGLVIYAVLCSVQQNQGLWALLAQAIFAIGQVLALAPTFELQFLHDASKERTRISTGDADLRGFNVR